MIRFLFVVCWTRSSRVQNEQHVFHRSLALSTAARLQLDAATLPPVGAAAGSSCLCVCCCCSLSASCCRSTSGTVVGLRHQARRAAHALVWRQTEDPRTRWENQCKQPLPGREGQTGDGECCVSSVYLRVYSTCSTPRGGGCRLLSTMLQRDAEGGGWQSS